MLYQPSELYTYMVNLGTDFNSKKILDYGGNQGGLLASSRGKIKEEDYTCVDVDIEAIEVGSKNFPDAKWLHYDMYNPVYNPRGKGLFPPMGGEKYDLIVAYSVFTHTTVQDFLWLLNIMVEHNLNKGGELWFSWLDIENERTVAYFVSHLAQEYGKSGWPFGESYCYLGDNEVVDYPKNQHKYFLCFYNRRWLLKTLLKGYGPVNFYIPHGRMHQDFAMVVK